MSGFTPETFFMQIKCSTFLYSGVSTCLFNYSQVNCIELQHELSGGGGGGGEGKREQQRDTL